MVFFDLPDAIVVSGESLVTKKHTDLQHNTPKMIERKQCRKKGHIKYNNQRDKKKGQFTQFICKLQSAIILTVNTTHHCPSLLRCKLAFGKCGDDKPQASSIYINTEIKREGERGREKHCVSLLENCGGKGQTHWLSVEMCLGYGKVQGRRHVSPGILVPV